MNVQLRILGLSAHYRESAAKISHDGPILAAAQKERFTRTKHDWYFPVTAVNFCPGESQTSLTEADRIVFYDKQFLKFERLREIYLACAPKGFRSFLAAVPLWLKEESLLETNNLGRLAA
jgi:carbamoyltransferase